MSNVWKKLFAVCSGAFALSGTVFYLISLYYYPKQVDNFNITEFTLKFLVAFFGVFAVFGFVCIYQFFKNKKGRKTAIGDLMDIFTKYKFLLKQLVSKEFKLKYRRSYLGIAWSLINPLLMMIVISAVFSFVFRFNIEHFPAYLIVGQATFNFFSEATQLSLISIVGSGQLIKKVYMPKCIFPISRVISSFVNSLITFIPVTLVLIYYGIYPALTNLYLPVYFFYFLMFTMGISLILATLDVFMRDIQHLYGVFLTALSYATPIFYPVDSLSPTIQFVMNFNPLYHYLKYLRNILFYHISPTLTDNVICFSLGAVALCFGMWLFVKKQNKFILYI